jgi:hypothetical protein
LAVDFTMADFVEEDSTVAADFMEAAAVSVVENQGVLSATAQGVAGLADCNCRGVAILARQHSANEIQNRVPSVNHVPGWRRS